MNRAVRQTDGVLEKMTPYMPAEISAHGSSSRRASATYRQAATRFNVELFPRIAMCHIPRATLHSRPRASAFPANFVTRFRSGRPSHRRALQAAHPLLCPGVQHRRSPQLRARRALPIKRPLPRNPLTKPPNRLTRPLQRRTIQRISIEHIAQAQKHCRAPSPRLPRPAVHSPHPHPTGAVSPQP